MSITKRPKLVWIITSYYFLAFSLFLLIFLLSISKTIDTHELEALLTNMPKLHLGLLILASTLGFSAAFALFMLKRIAFTLFLANLAVILFIELLRIYEGDWLSIYGETSFLQGVFGWLCLLSVVLYSWHLKKTRVLR